MREKIVLFLICFCFTTATAQPIEVSKATLKKIFTHCAKGTTFGWKKYKHDNTSNDSHKSKYECWLTQNTDSNYFLSDTIRFYNNQYAYLELEDETFIEWILLKKRFVTFAELKTNEPPSIRIGILTYRWKIEQNKSGTYIHLTDSIDGSEELFQVLSLEIRSTNEALKGYVMDLKRLK